MKIAELFIELGIKGVDNARKRLGEVTNGLSDISSKGLATKAAILGVVYAIEQLTLNSAQAGAHFMQFEKQTGMSTDRLQRWQYMMKQGGIAAEETEQSLRSVQTTMGKMQLGQAAPSGLSWLSNMVGFDREKAYKDTEYVMNKLREYLKKETNITRGNEVAASFGLSPGVIGELRKSLIDLEKVPQSKILSHGTLESLNKINQAWTNLKDNYGRFQDRMVAKYSWPVIDELSRALTIVQDLVVWIEKLIKKFPALGDAAKIAGIAIAGALALFGGPITALASGISLILYMLAEWQKHKENDKGSIFGGKDFNGNVLSKLLGSYLKDSGLVDEKGNSKYKGIDWDNFLKIGPAKDRSHAIPEDKITDMGKSSQNTINNNFNSNVYNNGEDVNASEWENIMSRSLAMSLRQSPALGQLA